MCYIQGKQSVWSMICVIYVSEQGHSSGHRFIKGSLFISHKDGSRSSYNIIDKYTEHWSLFLVKSVQQCYAYNALF